MRRPGRKTLNVRGRVPLVELQLAAHASHLAVECHSFGQTHQVNESSLRKTLCKATRDNFNITPSDRRSNRSIEGWICTISIEQDSQSTDRFRSLVLISMSSPPRRATGPSLATSRRSTLVPRTTTTAPSSSIPSSRSSPPLTAAFVHGANDVANAVGPYATIYQVWKEGQTPEESRVPV
jgi:hypothetical protein